MKSMTKRLLSLFMVVILVLGLSTSAMAATDSGSTGESSSSTEPTEPTEEPNSKPELEIHPDPIMEDNPFDPEWPYPYGLPVGNDFPSNLLEDDPYAIAPYADMSKIPEEMYDSYILRALEYTGYDVQYLKNNGYLFVAQYTSSNLSTYAPQVLSNIGYDDYGLDSEVFAVLSIPRLELTMPVYLGATARHMADGAAQMTATSLPIGGINTNCVIAGHRGWNGAPYFLHIPTLEVGDEVTITNLWETLTYTVVETKIISPTDVDAIRIQRDRDLITLLTCHPPATGGRQRYLVFCERVYP